MPMIALPVTDVVFLFFFFQQMMVQIVTVTNWKLMGVPYTVNAVFQSSYRLYAEQ